MKISFFQSLRFRLHIVVILLFFLVGGITLFVMHTEQTRRNVASMELFYEDFTTFIANTVEKPLWGRSYYFLQEMALGVMQIKDVIFFDIRDCQGVSLLAEEGSIGERDLERPLPESGNTYMFSISRDITSRKMPLGSIHLLISSKQHHLEARKSLWMILVIFLAGLLLIETLLVLAMERLFIAPIMRLSQTANQIGKGHFVTTPLGMRKDEIGTLSRTFNTMSKNLEELVAERTRELSQANRMLRSEIQRRQCLEEELRSMATTDRLTGILNRHAFEEELARQRNGSDSPWSLIMFDLDNFKAVNDDYGHAMGDMVLQRVAFLATSMLSQKDLFCRWGGEEFLIAVSLEEDKARRKAEKIRREFQDFWHPEIPPFTASFGVAQFPQKGAWEATFILVDQRMYQAKEAGKNRIFPEA